MTEPPFAALVRRRLDERGLGLREFCRAVRLDPSFFSKVLAGKRSPPSEDAVLRRIAGALELDACELIVAAGRIPSEWSRLWSERHVLEAVRRLCAGEAPAGPALAARRLAGSDPRRLPAPQAKPLGEELL
ncbi:MAG: helix-turn-helix transcriptional regulator [Elusimicrobia bacterium]|nr:helix-turn-helix transcriptional regulator [Elusimicrobiota bacterium]